MKSFVRHLSIAGAMALLTACGGGGGGHDRNSAPTIAGFTDRAINENTSTGAIAFTVNDAETAAASLSVSVSSADTTLLPTASLVLAGTGGNRTLTVTPAADQIGQVRVTITVSDGAAQTSASFLLTVNPVNVSFIPYVKGLFPLAENTDASDLTHVRFVFDTNDDETAFDDELAP